MSMAYQHIKDLDDKKMTSCFQKYMEHGGRTISRAEYEANLHAKLGDNAFLEDIQTVELAHVAQQHGARPAGRLDHHANDRVLHSLPDQVR